MPLIDKPIEQRTGYQEGSNRDAFQRELSTRILTDIDDGRHDPLDETEGRA